MTQQRLERGLSNRHIQLIALGGAIGTGLFLGSAGVLALAGPSMILGYALVGGVAFLIMRQLGEMAVQEPVAGSFAHFAQRYWSGYAGFLAGWNYWVLYVLVGMTELTAVGTYLQFWWPELPSWLSLLGFFVLINGVNLASVRLFGEAEFAFALIKLVAILGMMLWGSYQLINAEDPQIGLSNLWTHGGFFPHGAHGLLMAVAWIVFSFGGLELIGITAAEAAQPERVIPKAINQVVYRILVFYVGALAVLLSLCPWDLLLAQWQNAADPYTSSPFVRIFSVMGQERAAHVLNVVVLTAALSVYNSALYSNSRMLFGLAVQGDAPKALAQVNARGVPVRALAASSVCTLGGVALNYWAPHSALVWLMSLVVSTLVINWAMISVTHLKFRHVLRGQGVCPAFPALCYPWANYLCLGFMGVVLLVLLLTPSLWMSVVAIPPWLFGLYVVYRWRKGNGCAL